MEEPTKDAARDALLKKCRSAQKKARLRGLPPPRRVKKVNTKDAAAPVPAVPVPATATATATAGTYDAQIATLTEDMLKDFRKGELPGATVKELADLEKDLYENCGGDMAAFCQARGIDDTALPAIQGSITDMLAGMSLEDSLANTMKTLAATRANNK